MDQERQPVLTRTELQAIYQVIEDTLMSKSQKYGNSWNNPIRIFSKAPSSEQINVRLDDKLSRIANANSDEDEDVDLDLMGYMFLRMVTRARAKKETT